eukprot:6255836-Prymnesium_polylepis.1
MSADDPQASSDYEIYELIPLLLTDDERLLLTACREIAVRAAHSTPFTQHSLLEFSGVAPLVRLLRPDEMLTTTVRTAACKAVARVAQCESPDGGRDLVRTVQDALAAAGALELLAALLEVAEREPCLLYTSDAADDM